MKLQKEPIACLVHDVNGNLIATLFSERDWKVRRIVSGKTGLVIKNPTFSDVPMDGIFRAYGGNVFQKITREIARKITLADGTLSDGTEIRFLPDNEVLEIFPEDMVADVSLPPVNTLDNDPERVY